MTETSDSSQKPIVVLLSADLMSSARLEGAVRKQNAVLAAASTEERAVELADDAAVRLILIDLTLPGLDLAEWVPLVHARFGGRVKLAAYGPHVHEKSLETARQAGCDAVLSRGLLNRKIDDLLTQFLREP